jgi:hypothetical protein
MELSELFIATHSIHVVKCHLGFSLLFLDILDYLLFSFSNYK